MAYFVSSLCSQLLMRLHLQTAVASAYLEVKEGFTESLFAKLAPPFPPVKVRRFDGCKTGDTVDLELNFIFFKQKWTSKITEDHCDAQEFLFVDEGIVLPFFWGSGGIATAFWRSLVEVSFRTKLSLREPIPG